MKMIKKTALTIILSLIAASANAGHYDNNYTYAQVVDVQPVYESYQVPQNRRVCTRSNGHRVNSNAGGAVLGGILGGIIGNNFGKGRGRDAATATGILVGAAIGANSGKKNHNGRVQYGNSPHCYTQREYYEEQRIAGYDVAYEYNGQVYYTRMQNHPGNRVRVQVNVQIAEY